MFVLSTSREEFARRTVDWTGLLNSFTLQAR
jgi:hypothetical protein